MSEKSSDRKGGGALVKRQEEKSGLPAKTRKAGLPARRKPAGPPTRKPAFEQYIEEITRVPLLTREEELELARVFKETGDQDAGKRLVEANLRFVVKMAHSYKQYNVKLIDLIQEGNIGLMKAVDKFNPDRGYRLISYAVWWIKAYMQNYIIRSWSMVKLGTTQMQRQLFFRNRPDKDSFEQEAVVETLQDDVSGSSGGAVFVPAEVRKKKASSELGTAARDFSLDAVVDSQTQMTYLDLLPSGDPGQEEQLGKHEVMDEVAQKLNEFIASLPDKELYIVEHRLLTDEPETLQDIGERFGVSRERIRQIESGLKGRLRETLGDIEGIADIV
jgi:RNA polymerase sigma-32 factor